MVRCVSRRGARLGLALVLAASAVGAGAAPVAALSPWTVYVESVYVSVAGVPLGGNTSGGCIFTDADFPVTGTCWVYIGSLAGPTGWTHLMTALVCASGPCDVVTIDTWTAESWTVNGVTTAVDPGLTGYAAPWGAGCGGSPDPSYSCLNDPSYTVGPIVDGDVVEWTASFTLSVVAPVATPTPGPTAAPTPTPTPAPAGFDGRITSFSGDALDELHLVTFTAGMGFFVVSLLLGAVLIAQLRR